MLKPKNTRAHVLKSKRVSNYLLDYMAYDPKLARNLNLLINDIFGNPEKPCVIGKEFLKAIELLPTEEHMALVKYYGLIGPEYEPISYKAIASIHKTREGRIKKLIQKAFYILKLKSRMAMYYEEDIKSLQDMVNNPTKYVPISLLYHGFSDTYMYYMLTQMGINTIYSLASVNPDEIEKYFIEKKRDVRYCDILSIINKAKNFKCSDEILSNLFIETPEGLILIFVSDLIDELSPVVIELLQENNVNTVLELMCFTKIEVQFSVDGNFLYTDEIFEMRKKFEVL